MMHDYWTTPEKKRKKEPPIKHGKDVWVPQDLRGRADSTSPSSAALRSAPSPRKGKR